MDARIVERERTTESNRITLLDLSCSWVENRKIKEEEKAWTFGAQETVPRDSVKALVGEERWRYSLRKMQ